MLTSGHNTAVQGPPFTSFLDVDYLAKNKDATGFTYSLKSDYAKRLPITDEEMLAVSPVALRLYRILAHYAYPEDEIASAMGSIIYSLRGQQDFLVTTFGTVVLWNQWDGLYDTDEAIQGPHVLEGKKARHGMLWGDWEANYPGFKQQYELLSALCHSSEDTVIMLKAHFAAKIDNVEKSMQVTFPESVL